MDDHQFDALTRSFTLASRRGVLASLAGGVLAAVPCGFGGECAVALGRRVSRRRHDQRGHLHEQRKHKKKKKKKTGCAPTGQIPTQGQSCCPGLVPDGAGMCVQPGSPSPPSPPPPGPPPPPCAQSCSGCCDGETCEAGSSAAACGSGGAPCAVCSGLQGTCFSGACHCDVCASGCPFTLVQAAIDAASPGAIVTICAGVYSGNVTIDKNLTLTGAGEGGAGQTRLEGTGVNAVVTLQAGTIVNLHNLRITGGIDGGGIRNEGTLALSGCTVSENKAQFLGGGMANLGNATLIGCIVSGNKAQFLGGGIYSPGTLALTGCTVSGNTTTDSSGGGGIFNQGTVACTNSTVSGNTAGNLPVVSNCVDSRVGSGCATCPA